MPRKPWGYWSKRIGLKDGTLEYRQWYWKNVEKPKQIKERLKMVLSRPTQTPVKHKRGHWMDGFFLEGELRRKKKAKRILEHMSMKRGSAA